MGTTKNKKRSNQTHQSHGFWDHHKRLRNWLIGIVSGIILLILAIYIAFQISPWPGALLIRYEFDKNGTKVAEAMEKHVPAGVTQIENQQYRPNDKDGYLDVFYPDKTMTPLPTVVWVHGGAWVSGDKNNIDNYLKIVASHGYTAVGVDYTIAPEAQYPTPLLQLNDALTYLQKNANRLNINPDNIILAGDSAGSQIVAQMATIITNPAYAQEINIKPVLATDKLRGMVLNCGAYDLGLADYNGPFGGFLKTVLWAYSGKKDFINDPQLKTASVANYVTKDFPPAFITAGNTDPLLPQSLEFAKKLKDLNVPTTTLFYPVDHQPPLNHEYQFNLDNTDGQHALSQILEFLQAHS